MEIAIESIEYIEGDEFSFKPKFMAEPGEEIKEIMIPDTVMNISLRDVRNDDYRIQDTFSYYYDKKYGEFGVAFFHKAKDGRFMYAGVGFPKECRFNFSRITKMNDRTWGVSNLSGE
jgi:hypothetical protein